MPDLVKRGCFQIAKAVLSVFIEAARYDNTVPGNDAGMPESPAMVEQGVFNTVSPIGELFIAGVFVQRRDKGVAMGVGIDLSGFEFHFIYSDFGG